MKTYFIFFVSAAAAPLLPLVGVGYAGAFAIVTALSIVAMLALDLELTSSDERPARATSRPVIASRRPTERHPLAS